MLKLITYVLYFKTLFPSSLDLATKTNFQNKAEGLAYVEKYKLTYNNIILENVTCQDLPNCSFLLNDG